MIDSHQKLFVAYLEPDTKSRDGLAKTLRTFFSMCGLSAEVFFVEGADEVVEKALAGSIDIFTCDLSLNDDAPLGLAVIQAVKEKCPWLFCIAVSGGDASLTEVDSRPVGFDLFIPKGALAGGAAALDNVPSYRARLIERFRFSPVRTYKMVGAPPAHDRGISIERRELLPILRQLISYALPIDLNVLAWEVALTPVSGGRSASRVFVLRSWISESRQQAQPCVIKIASLKGATEEAARYDKYVRWALPQHVRVDLMATAKTVSQGAVMYSFAYGNGSISTLRHLLELADDKGSLAALEKLLMSFGSFWLTLPPNDHNDTLPKRYLHRYYEDSLEWFNKDCSKYRDFCIHLGLPVSFSNHTDKVNGATYPSLKEFLQLGKGLFNEQAGDEWAVVHGDLNPGNIIVSASGEIALIDFRDSGIGHRYEDWITLEASVRMFWKWDGGSVSPADAFTEALRIEEGITLGDPGLLNADKGWAVIYSVRQKFHEINGRPLFRSFYYGLAYYCVRLLRIAEMDDVVRARLLATAYTAAKYCADSR